MLFAAFWSQNLCFACFLLRFGAKLFDLLLAFGFGLWALGFGLWALGFGLWALGFGLWALGFGLWLWLLAGF